MYAILLVDKIAETEKVLPTLASDEPAAMLIMLATAEGWCTNQEISLGYNLFEDHHTLTVTVFANMNVVFALSAFPITSVCGSGDLRKFLKPNPSELN